MSQSRHSKKDSGQNDEKVEFDAFEDDEGISTVQKAKQKEEAT